MMSTTALLILCEHSFPLSAIHSNTLTKSASIEFLFSFTARRYASAVYAMTLCLCLSQVGVLLKRLNTGSHKQNHTIVQGE